MFKRWANEAGYELSLTRGFNRSWVRLYERGRVVLSKEFEYWQEAQAASEAEVLARLGHMEEQYQHEAA